MLSDSNKRAIYDQVGEEGLKGRRSAQGAGGSGSFSGFPSGTSFTYDGFAASDPQKIFE